MSPRKARRAPISIKQVLLSVGALVAAFLILVLLNETLGGALPLPSASQVEQSVMGPVNSLYELTELSEQPKKGLQGDLSVHYIDVEQADCELIQTPEQTVLIDAGDVGSGGKICGYLKAQGVERIDLLIATHPHADHIGSMADVIEEFEIGKILFSDVPKSIIPTNKTYERLLDTIAEKHLKITKAKPGANYDLGGGASLMILGPLSHEQENLNDTSVVCRLEYGETAFLFTGDAGKPTENELLEKYGAHLESDVLKLGHHGSNTSTQQKWLNAVKPDYAIACVGEGNRYGHPHAEVLKRLEKGGITLYRTDKSGTVVFSSDGKELSVSTEK